MESSFQDPEVQLDIIFQALANKTRRALLAQLRQGPHLVTELAKSYKISLNAISKHLTVLERAGLIDRKIEGRTHTCILRAGPMADVDQWLAEYEVFWQSNLDNLAAYVEARHIDDNKDEGAN